MRDFNIEVIIQNKEMARDPVGETIRRDLLAKKGYKMVSNVRSGQYLRFNLEAENEDAARRIIEDLLNKLRIFNPVTQNFKILNLTKGN
ncbi:MAG: phosphoribosylformylglycinamidine synthase, purS protein [Candidatus Lokiarchaeota archaeon]|nr:phosphoribosylformylglycinamidine synthase, purS protein [Candidatus Lokiarchaeota archaeon]